MKDKDLINDKQSEEIVQGEEYKGLWGIIVSIVAISFSLITLYTAAFGAFPARIQRSLHLAFVFVLIFLLYPSKKRDKPPIIDIFLAVISACGALYHVVFYMPLIMRAGMPIPADLITGAITIILLLEALRRSVGKNMFIVVVLFIMYAIFGHWIPGVLGHPKFELSQIIQHLYIGKEGMLGIPLGVSSTFLFMFIIFGSFLYKSGLGKVFIDLALSLTGHTDGGPAKVSVISSGFFGMISGSSVANTVTTGNFTIPLMKEINYKPEFAAAVEAAASTGGQIMPPIMGAAAFIMAEMTGIPYIHIALAAIIPAVLYYVGVLAVVHLKAKEQGIKGIAKDKLPNFKEIIKKRGYLLVPVFVIVYLLMKGYTPTRAAYISIIATIIFSFFSKETRLSLKDYADALEKSARNVMGVAVACASAGMIVGVVTLTGLGLKIANLIVNFSGGNLLLVLFFTMLASILLGMGLPTTPKYIILATLAVPAMIEQNVPLIAAHLFVLYFGVLADVTPPVALAAYAGAGIANANASEAGVKAFKVALAGFIVPFIFVLEPSLVLVEATFFHTAWVFMSALVGIVSLAAILTGYLYDKLKMSQKVILLISSFSLLQIGKLTDIFGLIVLIGIIFMQVKNKKEKQQIAA